MQDVDLFQESIKKAIDYVVELLKNGLNMGPNLAGKIGEFIVLFLLIIAAYIASYFIIYVSQKVLLPYISKLKRPFGDILVKNNLFRNASILITSILLHSFVELTITSSPGLSHFILTTITIFYVVIVIFIINGILNSINDYYDRFSISKDHPIKPTIQIFQIIFGLIGAIAIVSILLKIDLKTIILSLGTASAILMLVFKDTILGFTGGMQLVFNKMLAIGDWISVPNFGADGSVLEINLTNVKVQNWDKTIVTVPTYSLITGSFQNWKGMENAGGRRIMRSINIDVNSVKFCSQELLDQLAKNSLNAPIIDANKDEKDSSSSITRLTNLSVFRSYLELYLSKRDDIRNDMTLMVRELEQSEKGIPVQIYAFSSSTIWTIYEKTQSDIFDHIYATIPLFDLRIFQAPSGLDLTRVKNEKL
jgi:miniconductance mechanosensitive channel